MLYYTRKTSRQFIGKHNFVKVRSLKQYNEVKFESKLLHADWSSVLLSETVSDAWNNFESIFLDITNSVAPVPTKQRTEALVNADVSSSIQDRNKAFNIFKKNKSDANFEKFEVLRSKTQSVAHKAKQDYFTNILKRTRMTLGNLYGNILSSWVCHLKRPIPLHVKVLASILMVFYVLINCC